MEWVELFNHNTKAWELNIPKHTNITLIYKLYWDEYTDEHVPSEDSWYTDYRTPFIPNRCLMTQDLEKAKGLVKRLFYEAVVSELKSLEQLRLAIYNFGG